MRELGRVCSKKMLMILAVLGIINLILFLFCMEPDKKITPMGPELDYYLITYPTFLKNTEKNSGVMASLNMYKSGYASESLKKTAESYRNLKGTQVAFGDNRGIISLIQYRLTDLFLIVFLFLVVMEFQAERKKGLVFMVRSTVKGRGILYLQRVLVLVLAALFGGVVFYGGNVIGVLTSFGLDDLSRSLQSLPEFMKCPYRITIGGYFVRAFGMKVFGCFVAAALFYLLVGILDSALAYLAAGFIIVAEFAASVLVAPISAFNSLRFVNIFNFIRCEDYFTDSIYLNVFGRAIQALSFMIWLLIGLLAAMLVIGFVIFGRKYVVQTRAGEKISDLIARIKERFAHQRTLFGWELYKLLVKQGGIVILAAILLIHLSISVKYSYLYPVAVYEQLWYVKFYGEITEQTVDDAERNMALMVASQNHLEEMLQEIQNKQPFNEDRYHKTRSALEENLAQQRGLRTVMENINSGMDYTKRTGNKIYLIEPFIYELLFNMDHKTRSRASFLTLAAVIGLVSGIFAFDRQNHMKQWIHTAYRGRLKNVLCKLAVVTILCSASCILLHLVQFFCIGSDMRYNDLEMPVQSLPFMRNFGIYISIRGYLILLFALRALVACGIGYAVAFVSSRSFDVVTAVGVSTFFIIVLVVLSGVVAGGQVISPVFWLDGLYFR